MSLIYKSGTYYGNGGGGTGGHSIKDNGVDMDARAALNFVDFDLTDNSGDDETDVAAHRLTADEMAEIMSTLPGVPTEYPSYSTTEQVVAKWINGKPLYQKTVSFSITGSSNESIDYPHGISNVDKVLNYSSFLVSASYGTYYLPYVDTSAKRASIYQIDATNIQYRSNASLTNGVVYCTMQYTKTTD